MYGFGDVSAEHDTIAGLDLRLVPSLGVGYQWVETPTLSFNTDAGISYVHRQFAHDGSDDSVAAQLAYHVKWKVNDKVSVFHDLEYYPALSRIDNYFFTANAGVPLPDREDVQRVQGRIPLRLIRPRPRTQRRPLRPQRRVESLINSDREFVVSRTNPARNDRDPDTG